MIFPRLERYADGRLAFEDLAPAFLLLLLEVPDLLKPDDQPEEVLRRLFPDPCDDARLKEDWKRLVHPELFSLLASAREIVLRDLGNIRPSTPEIGMGTWRLVIPAEHVDGWISALNAARLALGAIHGVETEEDLHFFADDEPEDADEGGGPGPAPEFDERRFAITKIHLLGELQAMLILDKCPPPPGFMPFLPMEEDEAAEDGIEDGEQGADEGAA